MCRALEVACSYKQEAAANPGLLRVADFFFFLSPKMNQSKPLNLRTG